MRGEPDDVFWERILEMPLEEKFSELHLRREWLIEQNAIAVDDRDGVRIAQLNAALTKVNVEIKRINALDARDRWKQAVRAIYGDEGVAECQIWMEVRLGKSLSELQGEINRKKVRL